MVNFFPPLVKSRFLKKQFHNADKNKNGSLTFNECRALIEQLNVKMDKEVLKEHFDAANKKKAKGEEKEALDQDEFVSFYYSLLKRPEIEDVFLRFATVNKDKEGVEIRMSADDLNRFQAEQQREELLLEECDKIIKAFEPIPGYDSFSLEGFTHFMMFSDLQGISDSRCQTVVYQDMTQPLSHYYMASSHNTYLTGNQVTGESSVDAYISALKKGCRCVERKCGPST